MQKWEFLTLVYGPEGHISLEPSGLLDVAWMKKRFGARIEKSEQGGRDHIDKFSHRGLAITELLTYVGTQGWDPVNFEPEFGTYFFKRPIED